MDSIVVMLAHPRFEKSRANKALLDAARSIPSLIVHDLYELYPDFNIDTAREQDLLARHRIIVWQYPLYMYSPPAILKQWMDLVLEYGWAHGPSGRNLENKIMLNAVTTGGSADSYGPRGFNRYCLHELLRPLEQTARLCKMTWLPVFTVQGTYKLDDRRLAEGAALYRRALERLGAGAYDRDDVLRHATLNDWIAAVDGESPQ